MKFLAVLAGAAIAIGVLFFVLLTLLPKPQSGSWDMGTPMLFIMALVPVGIAGAIAGYVVANAMAAGRTQFALIAAAVGLAIPVGVALYIVFLPYLPRRTPPPPNAARRAAWTAARGTAHESQGRNLALQLETCMRQGGSSAEGLMMHCMTLRARWAGYDPDSLARLGAYDGLDDGWRWEMATGKGIRALVFPDALFNQAGPVFDVRAFTILRRETRTSPAFATDSELPAYAAWYRCFVGWVREARASGGWNGEPDTLPPFVVHRDATSGCGTVTIETEPERPGWPWNLRMSAPGTRYGGRVTFVPVRTSLSETPFQLVFFISGTGYMIDVEGRWHTRQGQAPSGRDPPPPPCLLDPKIPCE